MACGYLPMLGLKLTHLSKRVPNSKRWFGMSRDIADYKVQDTAKRARQSAGKLLTTNYSINNAYLLEN